MELIVFFFETTTVFHYYTLTSQDQFTSSPFYETSKCSTLLVPDPVYRHLEELGETQDSSTLPLFLHR